MKRLVNTMNDPLVNILPQWGVDNHGGGLRDKYHEFNTSLGRFDPYFFYRDSLLRYNPYMAFSGYYMSLVTFFDSRGIAQQIKQL